MREKICKTINNSLVDTNNIFTCTNIRIFYTDNIFIFLYPYPVQCPFGLAINAVKSGGPQILFLPFERNNDS